MNKTILLYEKFKSGKIAYSVISREELATYVINRDVSDAVRDYRFFEIVQPGELKELVCVMSGNIMEFIDADRNIVFVYA